MSDETPRLHIDNDWKAQAQAEKERLAEKADARNTAAASGPGARGQEGPPPTGFQMLVASLASQAVMGLGGMQDPETGKVMIDLESAQFAMGMLGVLHEKTKGNLTPEEASELQEVVQHLQQRFMQIAQLVASQMQRESAAGVGASPVLGSIGSPVPASRAATTPRIEMP